MPDTATLPPATPAPVTSPAPAPKPAAAAPAPSSTPQPGSRESIYSAIEKRAKQGETPIVKQSPAEAPKPGAVPPKEPAKPEAPKAEPHTQADPDEFSDATAPADAPKPADKPAEATTDTPPKDQPKDKKGKELGPWALKKLAEERALKAERELEEYRKVTPNAERLKKQQEEYQTIQKRNEELESEIQFANYSKSKEFTEKYQKPYDDAWQTAMNDLAEIPVTDGSGTRAVTVDDIAQLVYMPLARAKEEAVAKFGTFADDVMAARKEIRRLGETRDKALSDAKTVAGEREKKLTEDWQTQRTTIKTEVAKNWHEANEAVQSHEKFGQYFRPVDGDEVGNAALEKGFKVVDEAFALNAADPKLTPEQRATVVKKQVAVRNRAAAFGRLTIQSAKKDARIAELEAELAEYKTIADPTIDGRNGAAPAVPVNERDRLHSAIDRKAAQNRG